MEEISTLAGGCFWCTEAIFKRLRGVTDVIPGYTGGVEHNPTYQEVCGGSTGHVECIQIRFNPQIISFDNLLEVFWKLHDPTTLNRQGDDVGTQYRSVIFYHNDLQKDIATKSKENLEKSGYYAGPVVTKIEPATKFYPAEKYHLDYYMNNQNAPYCQLVIDPKLQKLLREFKDQVLV